MSAEPVLRCKQSRSRSDTAMYENTGTRAHQHKDKQIAAANLRLKDHGNANRTTREREANVIYTHEKRCKTQRGDKCTHSKRQRVWVRLSHSLTPNTQHARSACMVPRSEPVIDFVEHGIVAGEVVNVALKKSFIEGKANPRAASAFACFDLPQPLELSRTSAQTQTWRACQHVNEGQKQRGGHEGTSTHPHTFSRQLPLQ